MGCKNEDAELPTREEFKKIQWGSRVISVNILNNW